MRINNERQLDDRGFDGMYLYVLSLNPVQTSGQQLPELIESIRSDLSGNMAATDAFEQSLRDAGYLNVHDSLYDTGYIVKHEEVFRVMEGFPRIIDLPSGTGDISYTITLSTCQPFLEDTDSAITKFSGGDQTG